MTRERAIKRLSQARETFEWERQCYAKNEKDKNEMIDVPMGAFDNKTIREMRRSETLNNIAESKARIAKLERLAR